MCRCIEYWKIGVGKYKDYDGNPILSVMHIVYCDHMRSKEQVLEETPIELTPEEWNSLSYEEKKAVLIAHGVPLGYVDELISFGKAYVRTFICPYCH